MTAHVYSKKIISDIDKVATKLGHKPHPDRAVIGHCAPSLPTLPPRYLGVLKTSSHHSTGTVVASLHEMRCNPNVVVAHAATQVTSTDIGGLFVKYVYISTLYQRLKA